MTDLSEEGIQGHLIGLKKKYIYIYIYGHIRICCIGFRTLEFVIGRLKRFEISIVGFRALI